MKQTMEQIGLLLNNYMLYIVMGLAALVFILIIIMIINSVKMSKMKKRLDKFMSKDDVNLEELLVQYTKKLNNLLEHDKEMQTSIEHMEKSVKNCIQKIGVVRYQAIQNMGADLSYTVALMDESNNGVVFNGIYGRDGCYTYAKPLEDGKSKYNLSEEEEQAIKKAIENAEY